MTSSWVHEERCVSLLPLVSPAKRPGEAALPHRRAASSSSASAAPCFCLIRKQSSFYILYFHGLDRGLPTARVLFTCQKPPGAAKLPTMNFRGSTWQRCLGHHRRGDAAKTWQLLQQGSLGSFETPFSVTSSHILITCLLFSVLKCCFFPWFIFSLKAQPVCWYPEQTIKMQKPMDGC